MKNTNATTFLIAHRGLSTNIEPHAPYMENTIHAIKQAMHLGYKAVEVDIQLSADKIPFLWHDDFVCTRTNPSQKNVDPTKTTYKNLQHLVKTNVLYRDNQLWEPQNKRVDNLKTVLRTFPNTLFCLELKIPQTRKHDTLYKYELVYHTLNQIYLQKHKYIVFVSFDIVVCKLLRKYSPFKTMLLTETNLSKAANIARRYNLNGVVFDGTSVPKHPFKRENKSAIDWWTYNSNPKRPFTKVAIVDVVKQKSVKH